MRRNNKLFIIAFFLFVSNTCIAQSIEEKNANSKALSKQELLKLIEDTNKEIKNRQKSWVVNGYGGTIFSEPKIKVMEEPVILYGKTRYKEIDYKLLRAMLPGVSSLISKDVTYYDRLTYYTINPRSYGIRNIDHTDFRYYLVVLNNRIKAYEKSIIKLKQQQESLLSGTFDKKWKLNNNENACLYRNKYISFSNQYSSQSWKKSKHKIMFSYLQDQLQNKEFDFELNFNGRYLKTNSKDKTVQVGFKIMVINYHLSEYKINSVLDKKALGKGDHNFKVKKENGYLYLYIDGKQLKKNSIFPRVECSGLQLYGNNFSVKDLEFEILHSKHNLNIYNSKIEDYNQKIEDIVSFFEDYKAVVEVSKGCTEYFLLRGKTGAPSVKDVMNIKSFVKRNPCYIASESFRKVVNAGSAIEEIDKILASNLKAREKYLKIKKIETLGWQMEKYKTDALEKVYPEIRNEIHNVISEKINSALSYEENINKLVYYYVKDLNSCEQDAGGEDVVVDEIGRLIKEKTTLILKSNRSLTNKISSLNEFLSKLQNGATLAKEHDESVAILYALGQKTIKSTVSMYYKNTERTEPLVTHREIRDETDIIDAAFGKKRYVEYTYTTGGNTYGEITGYQISGTIKNLSSTSIIVKARSNGSMESSGNGLIDFGRAFTAAVTHKNKFDWQEKEYTIPVGGKVNYSLSGGCSNFIKMSVSFTVIKVGNSYIDY